MAKKKKSMIRVRGASSPKRASKKKKTPKRINKRKLMRPY